MGDALFEHLESMELKHLYELIGLQPNIINQLERAAREISWEQTEPYLERLLNADTAPSTCQELNKLLSDSPSHFKLLLCYLECVQRTHQRYQDQHIPIQIYIDTMKCFPRFLAECEQETGQMYFDRGWWAYRQTSMQIFRLGVLEYEFDRLEGESVIALHIPSDARLTAEAVDRSLEQAGLSAAPVEYYSNHQICCHVQGRPLAASACSVSAFFRLLLRKKL